jgi:DNA-binding FadR family transcriptional regulator
MSAVQRSSLPDQVFRELVGAVLDGRYSPGERLPTQRALAADLGVNMASLREGIKRLEQLRLVDVKHGDAMRVRDWRRDGGLDVLAYAAATDRELYLANLPHFAPIVADAGALAPLYAQAATAIEQRDGEAAADATRALAAAQEERMCR